MKTQDLVPSLENCRRLKESGITFDSPHFVWVKRELPEPWHEEVFSIGFLQAVYDEDQYTILYPAPTINELWFALPNNGEDLTLAFYPKEAVHGTPWVVFNPLEHPSKCIQGNTAENALALALLKNTPK